MADEQYWKGIDRDLKKLRDDEKERIGKKKKPLLGPSDWQKIMAWRSTNDPEMLQLWEINADDLLLRIKYEEKVAKRRKRLCTNDGNFPIERIDYEETDVQLNYELHLYQLQPAPPQKGNLQKYIDLYLAEKDDKYIAWFLHYYESELNGKAKGLVQRYALPGHFLDMKSAMVCGIWLALMNYDPASGVPFLTFKTRIMWNEVHGNRQITGCNQTIKKEAFSPPLRLITCITAEYPLTDIEVLNKAGITFKGQITKTALLLLGKSESAFYFDGFAPRITWTLYNADNTAKAYEHFDMPMLLAIDKVYGKIRNERYRYIAGQQTLFPEEVDQYDPSLIKEILNNCLAHSDYRLRGKINVEEFEDRLVFINEGSFIPETIEHALEPGYKPPYYRNSFLCRAMVNLYMIDTNSMGIPMMYKIQRDKCFPLPTYDLDTANRVKVTVYGKILDTNYTQLLHANENLNIQTVFLLDQIQKKQTISTENYHMLKKNGLVEGRYPNIFVAFKIADAVGQKTSYISNRGLDENVCKQLVLQTLKIAPASKQEIFEVLDRGALSAILSDDQKSKKVSNLLQKMRMEGLIKPNGARRHAKWRLK